jgi:dihydrofolate reductase
MKITVIANISANGKVLLAENSNHQVPQEAMGIFMQIANQAGNLVIGKKTFEIFKQFPGGANSIFPNVEIVVLSTSETTKENYKVVRSSEEAIKYLAEKGFKEIAVGGGTKAYNAFLDKDLITDIYFNVSPIITGNGGVLGTNNELTKKFRLNEHKLLSGDILQLHLNKI